MKHNFWLAKAKSDSHTLQIRDHVSNRSHTVLEDLDKKLQMHAYIPKIAFSYLLRSSQINSYYNGHFDASHQNKTAL